MRLKTLIYSLTALICLSCAKAEIASDEIFAIIKGKVTDEEGVPIEHMEVTIDMSRRHSSKTLYTSSEGTFICDMTVKEVRNIKDILITLSDTDGTENGGLFNTHSENIHLYDEPAHEMPMTLHLDFRCSRATL